MAASVTYLSSREGVLPWSRTLCPSGGTLGVRQTSWPPKAYQRRGPGTGFRGAWVLHAPR